jgi:hypothetical protein
LEGALKYIKYIKIAGLLILSITLLSLSVYGLSKYNSNKNSDANSSGQVPDSKLVDNANLVLSTADVLSPIEGEDTNIVTFVESLIGADSTGIKITIVSSEHPQIGADGSVIYGDTPVSGEITIKITKNNTTITQKISITVPPHQVAAEEDKTQIAAAKKALESTIFNPTEKTDSNIIAMAKKVVDTVSNGITVTIALSNNTQVSADGKITYGAKAVTGNIKFILNKNFATGSQIVSVTIPAKASIWSSVGKDIGKKVVKIVLSDPTTTTTTTSSSVVTTVPQAVTTTTIDSNIADINTAKTALSSVTLSLKEGTDTNIVPVAQSIVNSVITGATVNIISSSNSQISSNGNISYGSSAVQNSVTFSITKGSVTSSQNVIAAVPARTVNVTTYGATGNGVTDDTASIQSAINYINSLGGGNVYIPDGTYMIDAAGTAENGGVKVKSNVNLLLATNASLKAITNSNNAYQIVWFNSVSNASLTGGKVIGDRHTHTGTTGETGYGVRIQSSANISVSNVNISDCWGDGVIVGGFTTPYYSQNITLTNITSDGNRRQGVSVISVKGLTISGGTYTNTSGTAPQAGIDFEPNEPRNVIQDVLVENVSFINNTGWGIDWWFYHLVGGTGENVTIDIKNCTVTGNGTGQIRYSGGFTSANSYYDYLDITVNGVQIGSGGI